MTLWIIIGSLVAVVAIFLVVMSIRDRKKLKVEKKQIEAKEKAINDSRENVIFYMNVVIEQNDKLLKEFIPSVGKLKMSDIRDRAKKALKEFKFEEEYKLAADGEKNAKMLEVYSLLEKTNSNTWSKNLEKEVSDIKKEVSEMDKDFLNSYKKVALTKYKEAIK